MKTCACVAAVLAVAVMGTSPAYAVSDEGPFPVAQACQDTAGNWMSRSFMRFAAFRQVVAVQNRDKTFTFAVPDSPKSGQLRFLGALPEYPASKGKAIARAKSLWLGAVIFSNGGTIDFAKPDYRVQVFVDTGKGCVTVYPSPDEEDVVLEHDVLADIVGNEL
jgi:hypothetical protein